MDYRKEEKNECYGYDISQKGIAGTTEAPENFNR